MINREIRRKSLGHECLPYADANVDICNILIALLTYINKK